ncbi:MAG: hypothetical protein ACYDH9_03835 [Limisphaerales bacterium]
MLLKPTKAMIANAVLPRALEGRLPAARDFLSGTHIRELRFAEIADGPPLAGVGCQRADEADLTAPLALLPRTIRRPQTIPSHKNRKYETLKT